MAAQVDLPQWGQKPAEADMQVMEAAPVE